MIVMVQLVKGITKLEIIKQQEKLYANIFGLVMMFSIDFIVDKDTKNGALNPVSKLDWKEFHIRPYLRPLQTCPPSMLGTAIHHYQPISLQRSTLSWLIITSAILLD